MPDDQGIKHFYIPDEQSIYLLSHADAQKLRDWLALCKKELQRLGYQSIELIGKGAFGFAFAGINAANEHLVFKFSRANLPQHVQDRLEEEAYMQSLLKHVSVPAMIEFQRIRKQSILVMQRAKGLDLEAYSLQNGPLSARLILKIAGQLVEIMRSLRSIPVNGELKCLVHGDIKPSNIVFDPESEQVSLIDWGSCVFAQLDAQGQAASENVMELMSADTQQTNARLGDVYFIGDQQLNGELSSPRFDEQGLASTLYALASGQSSRFGRHVITPTSLNLPKGFAQVLSALLSDDLSEQRRAGDYLFKHIWHLKRIVFADGSANTQEQVTEPLLPTWIHQQSKAIDSVVYSSRKSFLRAENVDESSQLKYMNDAQFERYYKNYLQGMGETEKAFIAAVSRLGKYPVVGGLAIRWQADGIYVDSNLNLYQPQLAASFNASVNNVITLARAIHRVGVFKSCMFDARDTLHIERESQQASFQPLEHMVIPFSLSNLHVQEHNSHQHSYFEDGADPDENLTLPDAMMANISALNQIHHTGCIIFEVLPKHLKIHSYLTLLDHTKQVEFTQLLSDVLTQVEFINGLGISGFMKLPYKDTRYFEHVAQLPDKFYPSNPKQLAKS